MPFRLRDSGICFRWRCRSAWLVGGLLLWLTTKRIAALAQAIVAGSMVVGWVLEWLRLMTPIDQTWWSRLLFSSPVDRAIEVTLLGGFWAFPILYLWYAIGQE